MTDAAEIEAMLCLELRVVSRRLCPSVRVRALHREVANDDVLRIVDPDVNARPRSPRFRLERRSIPVEEQAPSVRDRKAPFDLVAGFLAEQQRRVIGDRSEPLRK